AEVNVDYARNDASAFREYAMNILGIPEQNITLLLDATTGQMNQAIARMNLIMKNAKGKGELFVYYAGHGLPDEVTREPYIMPVDISGQNAKDGIKLYDLYGKLTEHPAKRVVVFIDACFSGGARNKALVAARGVKVRPAEGVLRGNIAILSATSGDQTALPYKDKKHGFFTYYLLKKLKETKGNISYQELVEYLSDVIPLQSVLLNNKEQTPTNKLGIDSNEDLNSWVLVR
ncbi:MAG TPA: caspase family protein, partial [Tenuifilaceae bacterium]|nr:caspase family protein [Tenuifilaceae bacterium]